MTNLTEQDLKRIEAIEAYLKNLSTILPIITNCKKEFTPYQPIDTTEGEPIETEQRWNINILDTISGHCGIYITRNPPLRKLKAQELQEAIKQYLSANKF